MEQLSDELLENSKKVLNEIPQTKFLIKMLILFIMYLFANYIFDRIDHEELLRTFHDKPYITIKLPNNTTFKIIISFIMIWLSHWVYYYLLKPIVYPKD